MQKVRIGLLLVVGFVAGCLVWPVSGVVRWWTLAEHEVRCAPGGLLCVGDNLEKTFLSDQVGGVTEVVCGPDGTEAKLLSFPVFLASRCDQETYTLVMSNGTVRTLVSVKSGRVTKVRIGNLHTIDL